LIRLVPNTLYIYTQIESNQFSRDNFFKRLNCSTRKRNEMIINKIDSVSA